MQRRISHPFKIGTATSSELAIGPTRNVAGLSHAIYYTTNMYRGQNAIQVNLDNKASHLDVVAVEYAGVATSSPLDVVSGAAGTSSLADSGLRDHHDGERAFSSVPR